MLTPNLKLADKRLSLFRACHPADPWHTGYCKVSVLPASWLHSVGIPGANHSPIRGKTAALSVEAWDWKPLLLDVIYFPLKKGVNGKSEERNILFYHQSQNVLSPKHKNYTTRSAMGETHTHTHTYTSVKTHRHTSFYPLNTKTHSHTLSHLYTHAWAWWWHFPGGHTAILQRKNQVPAENLPR